MDLLLSPPTRTRSSAVPPSGDGCCPSQGALPVKARTADGRVDVPRAVTVTTPRTKPGSLVTEALLYVFPAPRSRSRVIPVPTRSADPVALEEVRRERVRHGPLQEGPVVGLLDVLFRSGVTVCPAEGGRTPRGTEHTPTPSCPSPGTPEVVSGARLVPRPLPTSVPRTRLSHDPGHEGTGDGPRLSFVPVLRLPSGRAVRTWGWRGRVD